MGIVRTAAAVTMTAGLGLALAVPGIASADPGEVTTLLRPRMQDNAQELDGQGPLGGGTAALEGNEYEVTLTNPNSIPSKCGIYMIGHPGQSLPDISNPEIDQFLPDPDDSDWNMDEDSWLSYPDAVPAGESRTYTAHLPDSVVQYQWYAGCAAEDASDATSSILLGQVYVYPDGFLPDISDFLHVNDSHLTATHSGNDVKVTVDSEGYAYCSGPNLYAGEWPPNAADEDGGEVPVDNEKLKLVTEHPDAFEDSDMDLDVVRSPYTATFENIGSETHYTAMATCLSQDATSPSFDIYVRTINYNQPSAGDEDGSGGDGDTGGGDDIDLSSAYAQEQTLHVSFTGLIPGHTYRVEGESDPFCVDDSAEADAQGEIHFDCEIPSDLPSGTHHFRAYDGADEVASIEFEVAQGGTNTDTLLSEAADSDAGSGGENSTGDGNGGGAAGSLGSLFGRLGSTE